MNSIKEKFGENAFYALVMGFLLSVSWLWFSFGSLGKSFIDPDDAMRLVQIRDLLNGQSWWDLHQWRLESGRGTLMHWSRVNDIPFLIFLIFFKSLGLNVGDSEFYSLLLWPTVMVPIFFVVAAGFERNKNYAFMYFLFFCFLPLGLGRNVPGRIDHHAIMIFMTFLACSSLMRDKTKTNGFIAGVISVLCLVVGFENLPILMALVIAVICMAIFGKHKEFVVGFGYGVLVSSFISMFLFMGEDQFKKTFLDQWSIGWLLSFLIVGTWLVFFEKNDNFKLGAIYMRIGTLIMSEFLVFILFFYKSVKNGVFGDLDESVKEFWLYRVSEMKNVVDVVKWNDLVSVRNMNVYLDVNIVFLLMWVLILIGLIQYIWVGVEKHKMNFGNASYVLICLVACGVGFLYLRSWYVYIVLTSPVAALGYAEIVKKYDVFSKFSYVLFYVAALPLCFMGLSSGEGGVQIEDCHDVGSWKFFADEDVGNVMPWMDDSASVLLYTKNTVVSGPYHRSANGLYEMMNFWSGKEEVAKKIVASEKIKYVVWCEGSLKSQSEEYVVKGSMLDKLKSGIYPSWLHVRGGIIKYGRVE